MNVKIILVSDVTSHLIPPTLPLPEFVISALNTALDVVAPPTVFTSLNVSIIGRLLPATSGKLVLISPTLTTSPCSNVYSITTCLAPEVPPNVNGVNVSPNENVSVPEPPYV